MKKSSFIQRKLMNLYHMIVREKASPEYIAKGWAIGMFYGCLIPFGFQLMCSIPTAFWLKGSKIGATFGTLLTNPVTIFFIYPVQCWVGSLCLGGGLDFQSISKTMQQIAHFSGPWWEAYKLLFQQGAFLVASFFIGGLLLALITTPITYYVVLRLVRTYQILRKKHQMRKELKRKNRLSAQKHA